jgi:hypothetical protein
MDDEYDVDGGGRSMAAVIGGITGQSGSTAAPSGSTAWSGSTAENGRNLQ